MFQIETPHNARAAAMLPQFLNGIHSAHQPISVDDFKAQFPNGWYSFHVADIGVGHTTAVVFVVPNLNNPPVLTFVLPPMPPPGDQEYVVVCHQMEGLEMDEEFGDEQGTVVKERLVKAWEAAHGFARSRSPQ